MTDTANNSLRAAVTDMDCSAQAALGEIISIARLSLVWLETPDGQRDMETIAGALNTIWFRAQDASECIGLEAERVGCGSDNESQKRRLEACVAAYGEQEVQP